MPVRLRGNIKYLDVGCYEGWLPVQSSYLIAGFGEPRCLFPLPGMIWILIIFPIKTQYPQPAALLRAFYTSLTHIARNQRESQCSEKYLTKSFDTIIGKCHHFLPNNSQSDSLVTGPKYSKSLWLNTEHFLTISFFWAAKCLLFKFSQHSTPPFSRPLAMPLYNDIRRSPGCGLCWTQKQDQIMNDWLTWVEWWEGNPSHPQDF